ncbi:DUF5079 family protein [Staphylococcus chromogenes]|uniref:DUF5079 family protein n=2 Tax=Staphylococcus chromogenes TaxID=46126 RepID=UPI00288551B6|nr:DUF5079 family protein [Staphylococcus chromogenes]MDT0693155.1 DUF5079 family protein [Staphylococcus chromogenes]
MVILNSREMRNQMKAKYINDIKKAYITPLSILIIAVMSIMNAVVIIANIDTIQIPFYYVLFLIVVVIINIISIIKEKMKKVYYTKKAALVYLIITILAGYSLPLLVSSFFMTGPMTQSLNVVGYWLIVMILTFLSFLAVHIFVVREFRITTRFDSITVRIFAVLLKLASMIGLIYMSWIVPSVAEENRSIGISVLIIIASDLLIIRNYFSYSMYLYECELKKKGES